MARIFTTQAGEQKARAWFHDVTIAAGLNTNNLKARTPRMADYAVWRNAANVICDEIINRSFTDIDGAIIQLEGVRFETGGKYLKFDREAIAKAIVYIADRMNLYWDDTLHTPYEVEEFKKTLLGNNVYKYGRYISAIQDKPTKSRSTTATSQSSSTGNGGQPMVQPNAQPKNGYKQSGPQSGNARDLKGNPGEKVIADTEYIYRIIGDNPQSKNVPNVFINPLSAGGRAGSTNKVSFSSGNGYSDCTCFFDDPNDAAAFLDKIIQAGRIPANVTNPRVVKGKADQNGYFLIGTEFGDCAISAKKLNEALTECANEPTERAVDWKKATEGYTKEELKELHTWMRRG